MKKTNLKTRHLLCLCLFGTTSFFSNAQTSSFPYNELKIANYEAELSHKNGSYIENRGQLGLFGQPDVSANEVMFYSAQPDFFDFVLRDRLSFVSAIGIDSTGLNYDVNRLDLRFYEDKAKDYKTLMPSTHLIGHAVRHYYNGLSSTGFENIREIGELHFQNLYNGIDMSLTHNRKGLKALFRIAKGVNPANIKMEFVGLTGLNFSNGNVNLGSYQSTYQFHKPVAYQIDNSNNILFLTAIYMVDANGRIYFNIPSYNASLPVYVSVKQGNDPIIAKEAGDNLEWSSYIGEAGKTTLHSVTTDEQGNVYYSGEANHINFAANVGFSPNLSYSDGGDAFLIKFNENIEPQWYTFLGGDNPTAANQPALDRAMSITTYSNDDIIMTGTSASTDLLLADVNGNGIIDPTNDLSSNPDCGTCFDLFYARFNSNGILNYSTYYGGEDAEIPMEIMNKSGSIYIVGERSASTPLISQAGASNFTDGTGFIMKIDANNQALWFNSMDVERINTMTKNEANQLIIGGILRADNNLPFANPSSNPDFNAFNGQYYDGFIAVFDPNDVLTHTSYYGGNCRDMVTDLQNDFATGVTYGIGTAYSEPGNGCPGNGSSDIPIIGAGMARAPWGAADHVIFKFTSPLPSTPINFTLSGYFSGDFEEYGTFSNSPFVVWTRPSIAILDNGAYAITGMSNSGNDPVSTWGPKIPFPLNNPVNFYDSTQLNNNIGPLNKDAYIAIFDNSDVLRYTTFFGNGGYSEGPVELNYTNVNGVNRLYFAGNTGTVNLPTTPLDERLFTEPYEITTGTLYNDYYRDLGPSNQSGTFVAAWGSYITLDGLYETMSIGEKSGNQNFTLFPNPSENSVYIESSELIHEIVVYSMDGKIVFSQTVHSKTTSVDISSFSKGNYVVKVSTENSIGYSKLIKI